MHAEQLLFHDIIRALGAVLDFDERLKLNHAFRVALGSYELALRLSLPDPGSLYYAGFLHDIGSVGLSDHIVHHAQRAFSDPQARNHPAIGARIVRPLSLLRHLAPFIENHHEQFNGAGFPKGKKGDEIPIESSVILLADLLDVELRPKGPDERLHAATALCHRASGTLVPPRVAEAGLVLLEDSPGFVDTLFDDEWLSRRTQAVRPPIASLEGVSRGTLLSQLLWLFARIVDAKHASTGGHSTRVAFYAHRIGLALGDEVNASDVLWAGFLHDVGKVGVPRSVLQRALSHQTDLTSEEWGQYCRHAEDTRKIIETISDLFHIALPASSHHENYDGSGFPLGLKGGNIPLVGRIIAYADEYDLLTCELDQDKRLTHEQALERLREQTGRRLDPALAHVALDVLDRYGAAGGVDGADVLSFQQFFDSDQVDISPMVSQELDTIRSLSAIRGGVLLMGLEPWTRVTVSRTLQVIDGLEALQKKANEAGGPGPVSITSLQDWLDQESYEDLAAAAMRLGPGAVFTRYVFSRRHEPMEFVLQGGQDELLLLCRSAQTRVQSMKRLALFYRNFLSSFEAVIFTDPNGNVVDANRAFLDLFGHQLKDVLGKHVRTFRTAQQQDEVFDDLWEAISNPLIGAWSGELCGHRPSGEVFYVQLIFNSVRDSNGVCVGFIGHALDITARKRAEEELRQRNADLEQSNEKLERVSQFKSDVMAITSHDLRGPLNSLVKVASLLRDNLDKLPREKVYSYLDRVIDNSRYLSSFVSNILDLEKIESGFFELDWKRIRLDHLLYQTVERHRSTLTRPVQIVLEVQPGSWIVAADPDRIEQVISNLLVNAIKFSPDNTTVRVVCDRMEKGWARVQVCDEGPGLPPEAFDAVFDRYFQVKAKGRVPKRGFGTGLGLSIVKNLVELHGGMVRAHNGTETGAVFSVELAPNLDMPQVQAPMAVLLPSPESDAPRKLEMLMEVGLRVMLADDFAQLRYLWQILDLDLVVMDVNAAPRDDIAALLSDRVTENRPVVVGLSSVMCDNPLFQRVLVSPVMPTEIANLMHELRVGKALAEVEA